MLLFALSFQEQVEKYGVYVGIAAFFGLAVLSLLYFSQARELKRLREWAARAPDRARELEQRVVAQATASAARRPPAMPGAKGAMGPPRRLAEMPAPPAAAQPAATAQATELADAVPAEDEPATNGNVPAAPGPGAVAVAGANGAAPPADGETKEPVEGDEAQPDDTKVVPPAADAGEEAEPEQPAGEPAQAAAAAQATAEPAAETEPGRASEPDAEPVARAAEPEPAAAEPERAAEPGPAAAASEPEPAAAASEPPATRPGEADAAEQERSMTRPGEVPAVPRATPAQRVGVAPGAPAPMPLRQTRPSATPKGRGAPPRRPGAAPPRRPAGAPREGRSAGTIALFVGLAVLVLGGGAFALSQLGGDEDPPPPNRAAPPPTRTDTGEGRPSDAAPPPAETNVAVLNGTTFTGLAGQLADRVSQEGGYERGAVETNTRDQTIQTSTVYYADGFRQAARRVGELLSISGVEQLDADTQALAPDADVVVLAGADQAP